MDRRIVLGRASAVDAPEHPNHGGRRFELLHPLRNVARPIRAGDEIGLGAVTARPGSRNLENIGLAAQERQEEVAAFHVRCAEYPGLIAYVE